MFLDYIKEKYKEADERMNICKQCEYLEQKAKKCQICGCFMEFKTKWPSASCPIGKWTAKEDK